MTPYIPARPTTYKGIQMRSRTEARWAGYLDQMGWEWTYEPRAFANQGGQYLPDFVIPGDDGRRDIYVEIKPTLERAYPAMERMQVIWDSDPTAALFVIVDNEPVLFCALKGQPWRIRRTDI